MKTRTAIELLGALHSGEVHARNRDLLGQPSLSGCLGKFESLAVYPRRRFGGRTRAGVSLLAREETSTKPRWHRPPATDVTLLVAIDRTCYRVKRWVSRAVECRNEQPSTRRVSPHSSNQE